KGVASVRVTQVAAGVEVAPRVDTLHTVGRTVQFSAIAFDSMSSILPLAKAHWSSSDPAVARVDTFGLVTVTGAGTAKVIARVGLRHGRGTSGGGGRAAVARQRGAHGAGRHRPS